jgi:LacI family transcriptional regulator
MPTLEEIAQLAHVSRSTVSRVVNNDPNVSERTRGRVQAVIESINFQPNMAARSLAGGRTRILGFVIPMGVSTLFTDPFFALLIQGVSTACNALDHSVMLWLAEPEYERRTIRQVLHNKLIDGVIITSMVCDDPLLKTLSESSLPFIQIGRPINGQEVSYVDVDNLNGARDAVSYLLRMGYRRVSTITGPQNMIGGIDRLDGYRSALRKWGMAIDPNLISESDFTEEGGSIAMQRLLPNKPDAVFIASDAMAVGAMRTIREAGLSVPADIAIVSYDDMPFAARTEPPLTTVRQPIKKTGAVAAETLINMIEHPQSSPRRILLPTELVIRASCGSTTL